MFRPWYSRWQQECTVPPAPRGPVWGEFSLGQAQRRGSELTLKTPSPSGGEGAAEGGREGRGQWREERGWQAPGPGLGAARGSMRASGRARAASCSPHLAQIREGPDFRGFSPPNGIHRKIRTRGVRNHFISTQASDTGFGAVWGSTPRFGTHNSLPCIAWCSFRRGRHGKLDGARGGGSGGRSAGGRHPDQASGQPGAACAPLGEQAPPPAAPVLHSFGRAGFSGFHHPTAFIDGCG